MKNDRRFNERAGYTFRKYLKRWVELSTARKIAVAVLIGGGVSSATFGACNSSDITGPSSSPAAASVPKPSGTLTTDIVELVPLKSSESEAVAMANPDFTTSTKTTFPTTHTVHNYCMNEDPILNGEIRIHERLQYNGVTMKYESHTWWDTRGVAASATAFYDDDGDPTTPMKPYTVKYHNKQTDLDKFIVGPAGLPWVSRQESRIHLQRQGDVHKTITGGDDMWVYASMRVVVDQNGVVHEKMEFRSECK